MKYNALLIFSVLGLAIASIGLWLYVIISVVGWDGLAWLKGDLGEISSSYIITVFVVVAYLLPFLLKRRSKPGKLVFSGLLLYGASLICYFTGAHLSAILYSRWASWDIISFISLTVFASAVFLFLGLSYWFVTNYFIKRNPKKNIFLISILGVAPIPLSLLMIHIYNYSDEKFTGWVEAVKMGYPMFWITLVMGISGWLIESQQSTGKLKNSNTK